VNGRSLLALLAAAIAATGCGSAGTGGLSTGGDPVKGKELFIKGEDGKQTCGSCHTLADAGTTGIIGPNLDAAFRAVRAQGFKESSMQQLVAGQIKFAVETPSTGSPGMPADLVTGDNVDAVAAYVASVAGTGEEGKPSGGGTTNGKDIFTQNCATCHTLADAGTDGKAGPNLDDSKPAKALVVDRVTNGKPPGMPSFEGTLSEEQIQAVADYVSSSAGN
jgi:cbb3-type cytochrome c oxidase subunit III